MQPAGLMLCEELFLLTFIDRTGKRSFPVRQPARYGLAGALLADLSVAGRLDLDEEEKVVADPTPTGDPLLDALSATIAESGARLPMEDWIYSLVVGSLWDHTASRVGLVRRIPDRLVARGILERRERRALGVFGMTHYALVDGGARQRVIARLRAVVVEGVAPDVGAVMLLSVARACGCLRWILTPDELRGAEARIADILTSESGLYIPILQEEPSSSHRR